MTHRCPTQACCLLEGHEGSHRCSVCNWPHRLNATEAVVLASEKYDEHECYPEPPVDFAGAARIFFRQTQKLIDTVAELERKEIQQIVESHRDEHKSRATHMAGAAKDLELVKAECCEVILEDIRTKGSWANLPATPNRDDADADFASTPHPSAYYERTEQ